MSRDELMERSWYSGMAGVTEGCCTVGLVGHRGACDDGTVATPCPTCGVPARAPAGSWPPDECPSCGSTAFRERRERLMAEDDARAEAALVAFGHKRPTVPGPIAAVLAEVDAEVTRARAEHPPMNSPHEGWAVILEEVEEMEEAAGTRELAVALHHHLQRLWREVRADRGRAEAARVEAVQIAAMAVRYVLDLSEPVATDGGAP